MLIYASNGNNMFYPYSSTVVKPQPSQSVTPVHTEIAITPTIQKSLASQPLLMTPSPTKSILPVTSIQASITSKLLPSSTSSLDGEKEQGLKNGKGALKCTIF